MPSPELDVRYVAELARLDLSEKEVATFQDQLGHVIAYFKQLDGIDVSGIEPTAHANPVFDVLREDTAREGLSREDALRNAPRRRLDQFSVTKVIE